MSFGRMDDWIVLILRAVCCGGGLGEGVGSDMKDLLQSSLRRYRARGAVFLALLILSMCEAPSSTPSGLLMHFLLAVRVVTGLPSSDDIR